MEIRKAVVGTLASTVIALPITSCGGSTSTSPASPPASAASMAVPAAAADGTLGSVCEEIDAVMLADPDADPAGTAQQLEAIKAKITTPDADLVESVAAAYSALAVDPDDTEALDSLSTAASALGAGCQSATGVQGP